MCLAFPGKVKKIIGQKILVQYPQEERYVLNGENEPVKIGDTVLTQMGIIIKILSTEEVKTLTV